MHLKRKGNMKTKPSNVVLHQQWENFISIRNSYIEFESRNLSEEELAINGEYQEIKNKYQSMRNYFLEIYYPVVTIVATKVSKKIKEVDIDDLVSWGTDGLFQAINKYDPYKGFKFETFAIHRIRGSILDKIREADWVPRLVRQRNTLVQKALYTLQSSLGRVPIDDEVAEYLGYSKEEYLNIKSKSTPVSCVSISAGSSNDYSDGDPCDFQIKSKVSKEDEPVQDILKNEFFKKIMGRGFTPFERKIVDMHYYKNMSIKEIAEEVKFSESRVSQLHAKIISRLKDKVNKNPEYMKDIESLFLK